MSAFFGDCTKCKKRGVPVSMFVIDDREQLRCKECEP